MKTSTKLIGLGLLSLSAASSQAALYSAGHADFGLAYEGPNDLYFHVHTHGDAIVDGVASGSDQEFDAADVTTLVPNNLRITMPNAAIYNTNTGVSAGNFIWILPQAEAAGAPFLGIASEELTPSEWLGGITLTLGTVTSPSGSGHLSLWQTDGFGTPTFYFSTATGLDTLTQPVGTHAHFNWGFSEPGLWQVELTASGTHAIDGIQSDTQTFSFQVVPEPSSALLIGLSLSLGALRRRR